MCMATIHCGDSRKLLVNVPDDSVDCVVTDPPYDALESHRSRGTTTRLTNSWFPTLSNDEIVNVLQQCYRVLKDGSHCYVMCSYEAVWELKSLIERWTEFTVPKSLIWDKVSIGMGYNYRSQHEHILFCKKGKRKLNDLGMGDILRHKRLRTKGLYPTQKPVELFRDLILQSTNPGETVLDPFCGSGSSGVAAVGCDRSYIGMDSSLEAVTLSRSRIDMLK